MAKVPSRSKMIRSEFLEYGPLKINWIKWELMNGNYIAPALNMQGKPIYIAVNCPTGKINSTGENWQWKKWIQPIEQFEYNLIKDLCEEKREKYNLYK